MPRPRKNAVAEKAEPEKETTAVEKTVDDGLVALKHFAKKGKLFIGGESYEIVDGVVRVKPEHYAQAQEHIKLGG
jgi:hypothetical protein